MNWLFCFVLSIYLFIFTECQILFAMKSGKGWWAAQFKGLLLQIKFTVLLSNWGMHHTLVIFSVKDFLFHFLGLKRFCSHLALILTLFDLVMVDDLLPCQDKMKSNLNVKSDASVLAECSHHHIQQGRGPKRTCMGGAPLLSGSNETTSWANLHSQHLWKQPCSEIQKSESTLKTWQIWKWTKF